MCLVVGEICVSFYDLFLYIASVFRRLELDDIEFFLVLIVIGFGMGGWYLNVGIFFVEVFEGVEVEVEDFEGEGWGFDWYFSFVFGLVLF